MVYLDANFFAIALLDQTTKGHKAREIQKEIIEGRLVAFTSSLSLDEVMWVLVKNKKEHLIRQVIEDIYATPNLEVREVSSLIPLEALEFMEKYKLKPRDAFHAAIMKQFQIKEIVSDDSDFDRIKVIKRIKL